MRRTVKTEVQALNPLDGAGGARLGDRPYARSTTQRSKLEPALELPVSRDR